MPFSQTGTKTIFGWSALILLCFLSQTAHAQQCNELCFNLTNSEQPKSNETTQPANDEIYQRCHIICEKFRSNNTACRLVSIHEMLRSTVNVSKLCSKENLMTECQPCVTGGFYSHPNDQGRYYQCVYGVLLPKYCQSGTIWYQHTRTCIFDFLSRWKNKLNIRRDGLDVQPTQVQSASETMCVFGVYNPKCKPCENDSYHSKTASLTHFYHCKNGWLYLMYCPSGTIWNSTLSACVYGASSLCLYGNDDTDCLPCLQDTYYSKPGSVRQFYQCVHGWLFVRSCPTGTVWAGLLKECVAGSVPGIWNTAEGIPDISDLPEHVPDVTNIPSGVRDESSPSKGLHSREPIDPTRTNFCIFGVNQPRCRRCAPGTFYPKLKSTIEFYQCLSGWLFIMECPLNTVWDGESTKCIYDELASALRGINAKPENQTGEGGNGRETAIGGSQGTGGATGGNQGTGGATGGSQGAGGATGGSQGVGGATGGSQGTGGVTGGSQGTGGATGGSQGTGGATGGSQGAGGATGGSQATGSSQGTGGATGGSEGGSQIPGGIAGGSQGTGGEGGASGSQGKGGVTGGSQGTGGATGGTGGTQGSQIIGGGAGGSQATGGGTGGVESTGTGTGGSQGTGGEGGVSGSQGTGGVAGGSQGTGGGAGGGQVTGGGASGNQGTGGGTGGNQETGGVTGGIQGSREGTGGSQGTGEVAGGSQGTSGGTGGNQGTTEVAGGGQGTGGGTSGSGGIGGVTGGSKNTGGATGGKQVTGGATSGNQGTGGTGVNQGTGGGTGSSQGTGGDASGNQGTGGGTGGNQATGGGTSGNQGTEDGTGSSQGTGGVAGGKQGTGSGTGSNQGTGGVANGNQAKGGGKDGKQGSGGETGGDQGAGGGTGSNQGTGGVANGNQVSGGGAGGNQGTIGGIGGNQGTGGGTGSIQGTGGIASGSQSTGGGTGGNQGTGGGIGSNQGTGGGISGNQGAGGGTGSSQGTGGVASGSQSTGGGTGGKQGTGGGTGGNQGTGGGISGNQGAGGGTGSSQSTGGVASGSQGTGGGTPGSQGTGGKTGSSQGSGGVASSSQGTGGGTGDRQGTGGESGGTPGTGDQTGGNQGTGGVTGGSQGTGGTDGSQGTGSVTGGGVAGGKQRPGSGGGTSSGGGAGGGGGGGSGGSGGGGGQVTGKGTAGSVGTGEVTNGTGNRRMSTLKPPIDLTRGGTTTEPSSRKNNGFIPVTPSIPSLLGILTNRETIDVNTTQFCVFGVKNPQCRPCIKYTYYSKLGSNKQFYHCNYGVLYVLECPTQTVWNRRLGSCVYESNPLWSQNLLERPGQLNRTNGGFQLPAGANGLLANVNGTFVPVTSNLPKMKAVNPNETTLCISEIDNPQCTPCIKDYFYPKLNSLIQFYQCRIGLLVLLQCPVNTIWDGRSIRCLYDMMRITFDPVLNIFPEDFGSTDTNKPIRWRTDLSIESRTDNESEKVWPTRVPVNPMTTNLCIYEVNNTECEACEKGSYYPKAESIAEFYQCSHGILFLMQCPESTIWHGESLRCIYEEGDTFNYTNFYNESHGMDAINPNATSLCIFEANITDCEPCQQGGYYPIIGSLSEFFQCSHGQLVPMKCPARTIWNNKIIRCVYDRSQVWLLTDTETGVENADEIARRTEMNIEYPEREPINPNTTNLCIFKVNNTRCYPCQKGSYYPKYQSEAHFYQCSQGLLFLMNCPDNTIWHGKSIRCIYDQTRLWRLAAIEIKKDAALANDIPLQFLTPRWPQIPAGHVDLSKMCLFDHYEAGCQHCTVGITYSHPFRQDLYYKCVEGVLQPKLCPDGMWWHQMAAQCVHKGVYNMTFSQRPISIYEPIDPTTTPLCVFDTNNTRCIPCQPNSYYPKFKSISQFYQCSHGLLFLMQCPDKTVWNEASIKCVYGPERYWFAFVVKTIQQSKIPGSLREILHITNSSSRTKIA
ncbi:uncharacterized protein LOC118763360 isoform X7 [Octopus sinensis]|uniref:Uncharacterized protein LOC118763360 isoform X7 n=1 Tax=Octopus sinensis TaxID=2607531 RepID=A0A7E6EUR0_9MOLL|nr:uncharacterized protein LOC118763360 isoform X7 [Octopus sinensis]